MRDLRVVLLNLIQYCNSFVKSGPIFPFSSKIPTSSSRILFRLTFCSFVLEAAQGQAQEFVATVILSKNRVGSDQMYTFVTSYRYDSTEHCAAEDKFKNEVEEKRLMRSSIAFMVSIRGFEFLYYALLRQWYPGGDSCTQYINSCIRHTIHGEFTSSLLYTRRQCILSNIKNNLMSDSYRLSKGYTYIHEILANHLTPSIMSHIFRVESS
ncbi:unnamed protein product [Albugo candida]|uniref:Uncharacterized protein n=1 Tax=Albugo candida TaxID=65357 RepID=A0A024GKP4_9STRA|nr:unnamed protein product [Albugo candida]|eukprot:CCI47109.1 unnamed protein product [Albugo candida]